MRIKLQLLIDDDQNQSSVDDIIELNQHSQHGYTAGLSLQDAKQLLAQLHQKIILHQAKSYIDSHHACPCCHKQRRIKAHDTIQYRTLFGTVVIPTLRLYHCKCDASSAKTFNILANWLPEHCSPELQYIEAKWSAYMPFNKTVSLLQDILPISHTHSAVTVRNHLHNVAKRQEQQLIEKPISISGCPNEWSKLPKPDKPLTVGMDGGYVRSCVNKKTNFEVIVGKCFSETRAPKRFGFVQSMDEQPRRRLLHCLREQGLQDNQQISFLSDGADNLRNLQSLMHPESEHILDWFHLTMRFTVLNQFAKGLSHCEPNKGDEFSNALKRAKWFLWHGNLEKADACLDDCYCCLTDESIRYKKHKKMLKQFEELMTYVGNNSHLMPNYGERYRYGETITTSFVESTVNEVITKRMVKKQQMQWSEKGAHYLLQVRTTTLNGDLASHFQQWYPELKFDTAANKQYRPTQCKIAA